MHSCIFPLYRLQHLFLCLQENPEREMERERLATPASDEVNVKLPRNLKDIHSYLMKEIKLPNVTMIRTEITTQPATQVKSHPTKTIPSLMPHPLPPQLTNCDTIISTKKDAQSAILRASTSECKQLIHNVTCLAQTGRLYDHNIRNMCPLGRNPGTGFQAAPYAQGKGPLARVVFLISVHGRAYRQVKRLFKAIYHTDHYYFVHVDSVS